MTQWTRCRPHHSPRHLNRSILALDFAPVPILACDYPGNEKGLQWGT